MHSKRLLTRAMAPVLALGLLVFTGCQSAQMRGITADNAAYVSSTRPALKVAVRDIPLVTSGAVTGRLYNANQLGGLRLDTWASFFAKGAEGPAVVVVQAELPDGWQWTTVYPPATAVDVRPEILAGKTYTAYTHLLAAERDAFTGLAGEAAGEQGQPVYWLVRTFEGIYPETQSKMVLQYREALPKSLRDNIQEGLAAGARETAAMALVHNTLSSLGSSEIAAFRERALSAISVERSQYRDGIQVLKADSIRWQYVNDALLGPVMERNIGE